MEQLHATRTKRIRNNQFRKKVLVVEDDTWFAESIAHSLANMYDVKITESASKSLDVIDSWRPDVLVLDVILGIQNAFTLLNEVASHDDIKIKTILLTSTADDIMLKDVCQLGVEKVLDKKSITPKILRDEISALRIDDDEVKDE